MFEWTGFAIRRTTGRSAIACRDADQAVIALMVEMQQRGEVLDVQPATARAWTRRGAIAKVVGGCSGGQPVGAFWDRWWPLFAGFASGALASGALAVAVGLR